MFKNFKATVRKWCSLSGADVCNLLSWINRSKSTFESDNPNVLVGKAVNERGEPVVYATAEPIFLVNGYATSPSANELEAGQATDAIDAAFVREAQEAGVKRVLIVVPNHVKPQPDETILRVIVKKVPQRIGVAISVADKQIEKKFTINHSTQTAEWVN